MRVPLVALMLLVVASPAFAEHGNGLTLTDLVVTFNPLTQSAEYSFTLANAATGPTGALYASITAHDEMQPRHNRLLDIVGIPSGGSKDLTLSMPLYVTVNGCILAIDTGPLAKFSNRGCAMTKGVSQAPIPDAPDAPEAPEAPGEDDVPPAPELPGEDDVPPAPELPPAEPPTLP